MIHEKLIHIKSFLKKNQRILGLDVGSKTIGLSISDVTRIIASALKTIKRNQFSENLKDLEKIIIEKNIGDIIIGLPINMDGTEGRRCQSTRQFSSNLSKSIKVPLGYWDERLSTVAVEKILIREVDMSRKRRSKIVDKAAATFILQGALDFLNNQ